VDTERKHKPWAQDIIFNNLPKSRHNTGYAYNQHVNPYILVFVFNTLYLGDYIADN